jgi:hypothetical protein
MLPATLQRSLKQGVFMSKKKRILRLSSSNFHRIRLFSPIRLPFLCLLAIPLLIASASPSPAQDGTTWPTFSTKGLRAAEGLSVNVQYPSHYAPVAENQPGYIKVFVEESDSGDSYSYMAIGIGPLPDKASASSFKTGESWDQEKLKALWTSLAKSRAGVKSLQRAAINWGENPAARIASLEADGEILKYLAIQYAIFGEKLVTLECGFNTFSGIEEFGDRFIPSECSKYFDSLSKDF